MPELVESKGRAASPSFYSQVKQTATKTATPSSNLPVYSVLILVGVAIVFILRKRDTSQTGPVLTLVPSYDADVSTISNITNTLTRMNQPNFPRPGSTLAPIVWSPNNVEVEA